MKVRDDALGRIATALELKYGVTPYIDVSGVVASDTERIANAITEGFGITTKTLSNGTELNELIRIAEAIETTYSVSRRLQIGNTTDEPLERIAYALEQGFGVGSTAYANLVRIAIALEKNYGCDPILDSFGCVSDGLHRIADVMESDSFFNAYSPPVELIINTNGQTYTTGDKIDYSKFSASVRRANGKITPVEISEIDFKPTYNLPKMGIQMITGTYEESEPED